jgi:sarcosine oxidase
MHFVFCGSLFLKSSKRTQEQAMYDAVVVGLGGVGSFALRALAKGGARSLGIERFSRGHTRGSSHGKTRIYRRAYYEHPSYVPWIEYSIQQFQQLEKYYSTSFMQECGTLLMAPGNFDGSLPPRLQASYDSAEKYGITVEFMSNPNLRDRFPHFNFDDTTSNHPLVGLYEPGGGILRPELIIDAALKEAEHHGQTTIREETTVVSYQELKSYVEIVLRSGVGEIEVIQTKALLISAGGWAGQLLPSWSPYLRVLRQLSAWIDVSGTTDPNLYGYQNMPTWVMDTPAWPFPLYGLPCDSDDHEHKHWLKVGVHGREDILQDASNNSTEVSGLEMEEMVSASLLSYNQSLLGAQGTLFRKVLPCLYTMTPDSNYLIGPLQESSRVFGVAGLSGHG